MAVGVIGTPTIMAILLLAVRPRLTLSGPAFTSLTQSGIRFNTYIGVPLVIAFYSTDTIALGALFIGFMVPFINVVASARRNMARRSWKRAARWARSRATH